MKNKVTSMARVVLGLSLSVFALQLLPSCSGGDVEIHRLDQEISVGIMPEDSLSIKATETLFELSRYPAASVFTVGDYAQKPSIHEHVKAVESAFMDMRRESKALAKIFGGMHEQLPQIRIPNVFTIISPFTQSVIVADTTLYIGLNHYLGAGYEHYEYFPDYVRVLKERARIPVDVAEALVRVAYPFSPSDDYPQVVSRMAYEGAVAEAVMRLTGEDEAFVLGYDRDKYRWLCDNEADIWKGIVGKQLLFSTDSSVARSLFDAAPHVSVLWQEVPGRAGRFIGHRLVKSYLDSNPSVSMESLLQPSFYESSSLLTSAKYNP